MKNKLSDLRDHLFSVLEGLTDSEAPLDVERAKVALEAGRVLVETGKLECRFLELVGERGLISGFFKEAAIASREPTRSKTLPYGAGEEGTLGLKQ